MDNQSVFGSGVGSYAVDLYSKLISTQPWSIQPIHNFFLLNYYELGLFGLFVVSMLFLMLIKQTTYKKNQLFHVEQSRASYWRGGLVLFIVVVACMDHFFYTIPQGQIILWLGVGFLLTAKTDID
jgi:O-antigen ligase